MKSFFDTDPEVLYNRKVNAEKRAAVSTVATSTPAPVVSTPMTQRHPTASAMSRSHLTTTTTSSNSNISNNMNNHNHFSSQDMTSAMTNHLGGSPFNGTSGDVNSHFSSIADNHLGAAAAPGAGAVNSYGGLNTRLVSNSQVNQSSFQVHSSPHIATNMPTNHLPPHGTPGSHMAAPGSHMAPGSMASSYSSVYHNNVSNMAAALHQNPASAGHFAGGASSGVHMGGSAGGQLHPAAQHPSSLHHRGATGQQTYDVYSQQVNQMNPLLTEPDRFIKYCSVMNNYPQQY